MHPLFVVADASENDNRESLAHLADERNEGNAIHFRHVEIDDGHIAAVEFEPGGSFETFGEELAGVAFLLEVSDQELGDGRVIIDEEEFDGVAGKDFHRWPSYNCYTEYKHYSCQPGNRADWDRRVWGRRGSSGMNVSLALRVAKRLQEKWLGRKVLG